MYDIDAGHSSTLRLTPVREAKDPIKERSDILAQIKTLWLRHCELTMQIDAEQRQSRPIPASASHANNTTLTLTRGSELWMNTDCSVARHSVEAASLSDNSDFWTHRHMAGPTPLIARTTGTITPLLRAAASGEIRDPVEALRTRERP